MYNDDFYYDSDDGMSIERITESEQNEFNDIEGIEADAAGAGQDTFDPSGEENIAPTPEGELRSTPENPLYDPETGERIPNGYTMKDWEKRKAAVARKQEEIKARIEKERKAFEAEQQRQAQLDAEADYVQRQQEGYEAAQNDLSMLDSLAGNGADNFAEGDILDTPETSSYDSIVSETNPFEDRPVPERWQDEFTYSINNETNTLTLEHYNGENEIVTVPSVAYDEDGNSYDVLLKNVEQIFDPENVVYVGISEEIPEDNFSDFFQNTTGLDYQEYAQAYESIKEQSYDEITGQGKPTETPQYITTGERVEKVEPDVQIQDAIVPEQENVQPDQLTDVTYEPFLEETDAPYTDKSSLENISAESVDAQNLQERSSDNITYEQPVLEEALSDNTAVDNTPEQVNVSEQPVTETAQNETSIDHQKYEEIYGTTNEPLYHEVPSQDFSAQKVENIPDEPVQKIVPEQNVDRHLVDEVLQSVPVHEDNQAPLEKDALYSKITEVQPENVPLESPKTDTAVRGDNNFTDQGRGNFVKEEISSPTEETPLEKLNQLDTSKAFQMPDNYNDGFSDVSEHRNAEIKSQLNDIVVSQASSVVMSNATALDSNTQGSYGTENSAMTDMLGAQSSFNDVIRSDVGISGQVVNHSKEDQVLHARTLEEAVKNEQTNYKEESAKESTARTYEDSTEKQMVKGAAEGARFNKEQIPDSDSPTKKEDLTDIQSRSLEAGAKIKIKDYQQVKDGIETVGSMVASHILNADNSEENDVKQGVNQVKTTIRDLDVLFGTSGVMASASLDAAMGIRQADLMALAKEKDVDVSKIDSFLNKQEQVQGFKDAMKNAGMNDREAKSAALKAYKEAKADLLNDLQEKGFTKAEAKALLKRGLGGTSTAQNLSSAVAAQTELLKFAEKNPSAFTDKELEFLKSDGFFNTAKHSVQISTITSKYFNKSGNQYLKDFNPAQSYLNSLHSRESGRHLGPEIMSRRGVLGKADAVIDPHSYNFQVNLTRDVLTNKADKKLGRALKKDSDAFTSAQRSMLLYQKKVEKHGRDNERKKIFDKNKRSIKNNFHTILHFYQKLDTDSAKGLSQVVAVKHGIDATYSGIKLLGQSGGLVFKAGTAPIRFVGRKLGINQAITAFVDRKKDALTAVISAKKIDLKKMAVNPKPGKGLSTVKAKLSTSKPVVGVKNKVESVKGLKKSVTKKVSKRTRKIRNWANNNPFMRLIMSPFKGVGLLAKAFNKIKIFFATIGKWILLALGVVFLTWLILLAISGFLMSFGKSIDITGHHVIMAEQEKIEEWVQKYLDLDDEKYNEAVSHADDDPINPYVWGGVRLYHYGVYEPTYTAYFNRSNTNCFYHEKGKTEKRGATNGFHIIYIDKDGNTIGSNTTNVKDVLSVTTTMIGNDWESYTTEAEDLQDMVYMVLNPDAAYVESEIYACSQGCCTYPQKHVDGDESNGLNWYQNSPYRAYECDNSSIYSEYSRLKAAGVKFFETDTYEYGGKTFYEKLVRQTADGCNKTAKFKFTYTKIQDGYYSNYTVYPSGLEVPDYNSWVPAVYEYRLTETTYENKCEGTTYGYKYDPEGHYFKNSYTTPATYAYVGSYYEEKPECLSALHELGFYGHYSRDYDANIPHTAIKACYGHKDLNVYITVLTKEDLIEANGGQITYKVPVHFSHETGQITEWTTKRTTSVYTYTRTNSNLQYLTKTFFEKGGFNSEEEVGIINNIYDEDWYELYGINVYTGAAIPDTLSREATTNRLNYTILGDVSEIRSTMVRTAYNQVGRIPYYWGGKAESTNIYANRFGTTVKADYMGRTRKGLDCSGFVQLMFCIASGADLDNVGNSTSSFVPSLGLQRCSYSDLKPGDIGMENLPGSSSNHIGIYAGNGMWIHCQGSPTNTVVYNNTNCFRYYYSLGR